MGYFTIKQQLSFIDLEGVGCDLVPRAFFEIREKGKRPWHRLVFYVF
jgi:hypothetical protein